MLTAAIRYELGDRHTFEFVEGTVPVPIAPGKLCGIFVVVFQGCAESR